jgi:hypothetical protein
MILFFLTLLLFPGARRRQLLLPERMEIETSLTTIQTVREEDALDTSMQKEKERQEQRSHKLSTPKEELEGASCVLLSFLLFFVVDVLPRADS